jgi:hypothetical protein
MSIARVLTITVFLVLLTHAARAQTYPAPQLPVYQGVPSPTFSTQLPPRPTTDPYASSRQYIQNLPTQQVQRCTTQSNGYGGYIQRCY